MAPRDRITFSDLKVILDLTSGSDIKEVRNYVAICMLYITGLRSSNLCLITIRHVLELRRYKMTKMPLIKNGATRHTIKITEGDFKLFTLIQPRIKMLCGDGHPTEPLFKGYGVGSYEDRNRALHHNTMLKQLNKILIAASEKLGKYIRTHSFRVTRISDMLEVTNIEVVAKIIGHNSVNSTQAYDRVHAPYEKIHPLFDDVRQVDVDNLK